MALRYPTSRELVEALQQGGDGARRQLQEMLRAPVARLMDGLRLRYNLSYNEVSLTRHALHAAETYLRTRTGRAVRIHELAGVPGRRPAAPRQAGLAALRPAPGSGLSPASLPSSRSFHSETFSLPYERVGDYWFGGDWFGGHEAGDGSLWVLVADITGHGYYAYLLASTLPGVWRTCWESAPSAPAELLAAMHDLLADCLPEGVYVEGTLVRLHPDGEVVAAPAGGSRLLFRRGRQGSPILLKLRGTWLGLARPSAADQHRYTLEDGDELLLATDGLFDQLHEHVSKDLAEFLGQSATDDSLFERVRDLLRQALEQAPQKDDITVVLLRRRDRVVEAPAPLPGVGLSFPNEAGDVPV